MEQGPVVRTSILAQEPYECACKNMSRVELAGDCRKEEEASCAGALDSVLNDPAVSRRKALGMRLQMVIANQLTASNRLCVSDAADLAEASPQNRTKLCSEAPQPASGIIADCAAQQTDLCNFLCLTYATAATLANNKNVESSIASSRKTRRG